MGQDQSSLSDDASADENFFKKLNCGGLRAKGDGKQTSIKPFVYSSTVGTDEGIPVLSRADMKRVALSPGFPQRTRRALWSKLIVDSCRDLGLDVEGLSAEWKAIDTSGPGGAEGKDGAGGGGGGGAGGGGGGGGGAVLVPGTRGTLISPLNLELQETIRLDLERAHFLHETIGPVAYKAVVDALRRVLFKFGSRNAEVGYCQGMDRLGATLLVYVEEEECLLGLTMIIEGKMWWRRHRPGEEGGGSGVIGGV